MPLDVRRLHVLREFAARGTVVATAEALAYTPSAVSQQLSALEREAGVALLEREGRRLRLTDAGRTLVARTEEILAGLERAEAELETSAAEVAGTLRIAAFPSAARALLPRAATTVLTRHPRLTLELSDAEPQDAKPALRVGGLDIVLGHEFPFLPVEDDSAFHRTDLFDDELLLALGPSFGRREPRLETLSDLPWIAGKPGTSCHGIVLAACRAAGFEPRIVGYSNDFAVVAELVAAGLGVALIPQLARDQAPDTVRFKRLFPPLHRRIHALVRAGSERRPAIAAMLDALQRQ